MRKNDTKRKRSVRMAIMTFVMIVSYLVPSYKVNAYVYDSGKGVSITKSGQVVDSITVNGVKVDAIYRKWDGTNDTDTTYSCAAFVKKFYKQVYNIDVYNLSSTSSTPMDSSGKITFKKVTTPQIGDIVRSNNNVHWAIVKSVASNGDVVVIHQNAWYTDKKNQKAWVGTVMKKGDSAHTLFRKSDGTTSTPNILTGAGASDITETTAKIYAKVSPATDLSSCGFYLGTDKNSLKKYEENSASKQCTDIWYNLGTGKWTSALKKGTTYYYKLYAVANGKTYTTDVKSFKTKGEETTPDTTAPVISNVKVYDVSCKGYTVSCEVTDNVGVSHVVFPTWTTENWQDDIERTNGTKQSDGKTYVFKLDKNKHNGELGEYLTHIYAYDAAGNYSSYGLAGTIVDHAPVTDPAVDPWLNDNVAVLGKTEGSHCCHCGKVLVEQIPLGFVDLNGYLDGEKSFSLAKDEVYYGVADIYINDELVASGVPDYFTVFPVGTKFEIKNMSPFDGFEYVGVHEGVISGYVSETQWGAYLSFNTHVHTWSDTIYYDETNHWRVCTNPSCGEKSEMEAHTVVTDAEVAPSYNSVSGMVTLGKTRGSHCAECNAVLVPQKDTIMYELKGSVDGVLRTDIKGCGTVDILIDGQLVKDDCDSYYGVWPVGTRYEITDIKSKEGYVYEGLQSGLLSGTMGANNHALQLIFRTKHVHTWSQEWKTDGTYHWRECSDENCKEILDREKHHYETTITQATSEEDGSVCKTCTICGKETESVIYQAEEIVLEQEKFVYTGKKIKPVVTVLDRNGKKISKRYYSVSYENNKGIGEATITVYFKGRYDGEMDTTFCIVPQKTEISKLSVISNGFNVKWKKQKKQTNGYQIEYSRSSKFTKNTTKSVMVKGNGATSRDITDVQVGKKYYVRIRTYKNVKVDGAVEPVFSAWSKVKKITVK